MTRQLFKGLIHIAVVFISNAEFAPLSYFGKPFLFLKKIENHIMYTALHVVEYYRPELREAGDELKIPPSIYLNEATPLAQLWCRHGGL